jgi:hypothetical protein
MTEFEMERLVVRLLGDVTQYMESMDQAVKHTQSTVRKIEEQTGKIQAFQKSLETYAKGAASVLASIGLGNFIKNRPALRGHRHERQERADDDG